MLARSGIIFEYSDFLPPAGALSPVSDIAPDFPSLETLEQIYFPPVARKTRNFSRKIGLALIIFALGGVSGPLITRFRLEAKLASVEAKNAKAFEVLAAKPLPPSFPVVYEPLMTPDGASIDPVNKDFSLIVPKVGINAPVVATVDPGNPGKYAGALKKGIAHASTSVFPDQEGTVYLFSHSTNYDWFVRDLNAVFYALKNLTTGDSVVVFYKQKQYFYRVSEKKIVNPNDVTYLYPVLGKRQLILQTCWPPGSTSQRLLIIADLVNDSGTKI